MDVLWAKCSINSQHANMVTIATSVRELKKPSVHAWCCVCATNQQRRLVLAVGVVRWCSILQQSLNTVHQASFCSQSQRRVPILCWLLHVQACGRHRCLRNTGVKVGQTHPLPLWVFYSDLNGNTQPALTLQHHMQDVLLCLHSCCMQGQPAPAAPLSEGRHTSWQLLECIHITCGGTYRSPGEHLEYSCSELYFGCLME